MWTACGRFHDVMREDDWRALRYMALGLGMPVPSGRYLDFKAVIINAMWDEIKRREAGD